MIHREQKFAVVLQAKFLGVSRGSVYYSQYSVPDGDLFLMRRRTNVAYSLGDR